MSLSVFRESLVFGDFGVTPGTEVDILVIALDGAERARVCKCD